jgi:outer membrane protein assembly factor BamB
MKRILLLLLLLSSLSFAGEAWRVDTGGGVSAQPLIFGSRAIVATQEGKVYSIEPPAVKWTYNLDERVVADPLSFNNEIIIPTESGLVSLDSFGAPKWELDLPGITGIAASDKLYVADANGIQAINPNGTIAWNFIPGSENSGENAEPGTLRYEALTPLATDDYVAFGYGRELYAIRTNGDFMWKREVGGMWNAPPAFYVNTIYVGTSEGVLYALDILGGNEKSSINLFGQISATPLIYGGTVIVGTSENALHGISAGRVQWSAELDGKVSRSMMLQNNVVYLTTTRSLYAINPSDGEILFRRPFLDWPTPPAFLANAVVVGTEDGKAYGIESSRGCSILSPQPDSQLGDALTNISGLGYSPGTPSVQLRINGGPWLDPEGSREWTYALDPSEYPYGLMEIECRVSGEAEPYSLNAVVHAANLDDELMTINYPYSARADTEFEIYVSDSRGVPIPGAKAEAAGETFEGDGNGTITLILPAGYHAIKISRQGYKSEEFFLDSKAEPTLAYIVGAAFLLVLIPYVYFLFVKKPKKKELIIKEKH